MDLVEYPNKNDCKYNLQDNLLIFEYGNYFFQQALFNNVSGIELKSLSRCIHFSIQKKDSSFWSYLFLDKTFNKIHVKVDWNRWIDEEDLTSSEDLSNTNFDIDQFSEMMKQYQPLEMNGNEDKEDDEITNELIEEYTSA
jgi:hypothetical protein